MGGGGATLAQEEKARNDMILEVIAKEKEVSAAVKKLQEDLANERQQHEAEVEERNEVGSGTRHTISPPPTPLPSFPVTAYGSHRRAREGRTALQRPHVHYNRGTKGRLQAERHVRPVV